MKGRVLNVFEVVFCDHRMMIVICRSHNYAVVIKPPAKPVRITIKQLVKVLEKLKIVHDKNSHPITNNDNHDNKDNETK